MASAFIQHLESSRLLDAGQPDLTFGTSGTASIDFTPVLPAGVTAGLTDLAEDPNGYVIVVGHDDEGSDEPQEPNIHAARLTPTGQLDANFGEAGLQTLPRRFVNGDSPQVVTDAFSRVYIRDTMMLMRLTTRGKLDSTFGNRGKFKIPVLGKITHIHVDKLNRVYAFGSAPANSHDPNGPQRATIIRINEQGQLDTSWASGGVFRWHAPPAATASAGEVRDFRVLPGDKLLAVAFTSFNAFDSDELLTVSTLISSAARLNADGALDSSYGDAGFAEFSRKNTDITFFTNIPVAILPDGTVLGAWGSSNDNEPPQTEAHEFRISADGDTIDDDGVDAATLSAGDIAVEFPDGTRRGIHFASSTEISPGVFEAIYKITPPDGIWDGGDNGTYTVHARGGEVMDDNGIRNISRPLCAFAVSI